jgi:phosphoenolpyruvate carboxykinase (GTP)
MAEPPKTNAALRHWVSTVAAHTRPDRIHWCDGSDDERRDLIAMMCANGTLIELDRQHHPDSYLHRSHPSDVARTEQLTFISAPRPEDVGPTNNWMSRDEAMTRVWPLFAGAMKGRVMYVVPYLMGPSGSRYSRVGVEITDSPYVALSLRIMTRMGDAALAHLGGNGGFVRGVHSLGDLSPDRRFIVHFPETSEVWSVGSGYGGNALLSKKCHALRIASAQARQEGWMAEHMLILGVEPPNGRKHYIAAAFPSACGKTNLAMLVPSLPGWKIETVGDDIAWLHVGRDGRLWAINPEHGMFGVAPGTSAKTNPNALRSLERGVVYTNVALRSGKRVWWEGLEPLAHGEVLEDWQGKPWSAGADTPAAHPNSRFTVPLARCPSATGTFEAASGVPISAILFGGRRARVAPLVYEARDWAHGVLVGATMVSETTAAATGATGVPRHDPMAMLPFCGINMGDYFAHWLAMRHRLQSAPRVFHVNWFRTDADGRFLWPGFGENIRVLKWIVERVERRAEARSTPIGNLPTAAALDVRGLDLPPDRVEELLAIDPGAWLEEADRARSFFERFGDRMPPALVGELEAQVLRLRTGLA